jgi:glutamine amidotransferase
MKKAALVEYGIGNLDSVARAVEECGAEPIVTHDRHQLSLASAIILPGVGAFAVGMENLRKLNLCDVLNEQVLEKQVPFLGICLGMQLLATAGWEGGEQTPGLTWIDGEVKRLQPEMGERVPHIGWNEVFFTDSNPLFTGIASGKDFYFAHSYHLACRDKSNVAAQSDYCGGFTCAVRKGNIFGVQFHPEKSQRVGLLLIKNFLSL